MIRSLDSPLKSYQHILGIKQILYCLPSYMQSPFDDTFRQHLLSIQPDLFLLQWLQVLSDQNKRYEAMVVQNVFPKADLTHIRLPIRLFPGVVTHIKQQFLSLQAILYDQAGSLHEII